MKLTNISRIRDEVNFAFEDGTLLKYQIWPNDNNDTVFLYLLSPGNNSKVFTKLGISNPTKFYKDLGIFRSGGDCPYCTREDLEILFNKLKSDYSVIKEKEIEAVLIEDREPDEYNWLY